MNRSFTMIKRPVMMLDHEFQEQAIEFGARGRRQASQLLLREHAGHESGTVRVVRVSVRHCWPRTSSQRSIQLISSACDNSIRRASRRMSSRDGSRRQQRRHLERLSVMTDHPLHEADVRSRSVTADPTTRRLGCNAGGTPGPGRRAERSLEPPCGVGTTRQAGRPGQRQRVVSRRRMSRRFSPSRRPRVSLPLSLDLYFRRVAALQ